MDVYNIRKERLQIEMDKFRQLRVAAGKKAHGSGREFADKLNISPKFLSNVLRGQKNIGHVLARRIEKSIGMLDGDLDYNVNNIQCTNPTDQDMVREFLIHAKSKSFTFMRSHLDLINITSKMDEKAVLLVFEIIRKNLGDAK